ncbi:hypothetical protein HELRODRAFT_161444 [Helobdella robusta]|uniref:Uncharacterized protein n=1 Tax=Helobdella robusta TaxID=6412 RepID=T1ERH2_HELRO|nr:hypothetical protein HELRODRAFT_161444 [Helobdella robusta]ESO02203.1 hypothetical protein HELRODRAFT_161444 [Helobdella robusta]
MNLNISTVSLTELLAIGVTDRDGIPLLTANYMLKNKMIYDLIRQTTLSIIALIIFTVCKDTFPEASLKQRYFATAYLVFEQSDRFGFGGTNYTVSYYKDHQIISFNKDKLIVTIIATAEANTGRILGMEKDFSPIVESMADKIFRGN